MQQGVAILGIFVADLAFRAGRLPKIGETIVGSGFKMGPGGKGSNQSVAAARVGAKVTIISKVGRDAFGDIALKTWKDEGIIAHAARSDEATGGAFIFVNHDTGENAIIVYPGAAGTISGADVGAAAAAIRGAKVFVTQLEQPVEAALRGLGIARSAGVITVFNPAPAEPIPDAIYQLCDYIVPNESEAATLTGLPVATLADVRKVGDALLAKGAKNALITLGERGALLHNRQGSVEIAAFSAGPVLETTGAGDAFVGGFAAGLVKFKHNIFEAAHYASAVAALSVMQPGTAPSMPIAREIARFLKKRDHQ